MINQKKYVCYDFETDSINTKKAHACELGAVIIDPRSLEIIDKFNGFMCPPPLHGKKEVAEAYLEDKDHKGTIQWHADLHEVDFMDIVNKWKGYPSEKETWKNFMAFCERHKCRRSKGNWITTPIPVGKNIIGFDNPIAKRLHMRVHKSMNKYPMDQRVQLDIEHMLFTWMENLPEPENYKMDTLRPWFGIPSAGKAHTALADAMETAEIFIKFMKFQRRQSRVDKFKGAFAIHETATA